MPFGGGNPFFARMAPGIASAAGMARPQRPVSAPVPPNPAVGLPPGIAQGLQAFRGWNQGQVQPGVGAAVGQVSGALGRPGQVPRPAPQRPTNPPKRAPQPQPPTAPGTVPPTRPG